MDPWLALLPAEGAGEHSFSPLNCSLCQYVWSQPHSIIPPRPPPNEHEPSAIRSPCVGGGSADPAALRPRLAAQTRTMQSMAVRAGGLKHGLEVHSTRFYPPASLQ